MGVKVVDVYWTLGPFDGLLVFDAASEEAATAAMLHLAAQGYVRTRTVRAFRQEEVDKIVGMLAKK